jgi:hypothetical protein
MPSRVWPVIAFIALAATPVADAWAQADSSRVCADSLASGGVLQRTALRRLTIDDPRQAFVTIPGVLFRAGEIGVSTAPDISIRGGVPGHAATYIDGAPVRFQTLGTQGIGVAENAIAAVCLTTGVAPAIVADVTGGVVNYVTRTGGDRLTGQVRWESDDPFGNGVSVGYNRIEGAVGGPLPIAPNMSFFLSATLQGQLSRYRSAAAASVPAYVPFGVDTVVDVTSGSSTQSVTVPRFIQWSGECAAASNAGIDCQGLRRPMDWATTRRLQGKVQHTYGSGGASLFSVTFLGSDFQQRSFPGQLIMDPALYGGGRARSAVAIVNWRHQLGALRGGPLALDVNLSYGSDDQISGPLSAASETGSRAPSLGIEMGTLEFTGPDVLPLPVTDRLVRNVRTNSGQRVPYPNRNDLVNRQPYRLNPFGVLTSTAWPSAGLNGLLTFVTERRLQGRWSLDWRPGPAHHVTVGVDAEHTNLSKYQSAMITQASFEAFVESPARVGAFASDRLMVGAAVLDVGLRVDRITPGGEFATTPGRIFTNPQWFFGADTSDALYRSSVARVFTKVGSQTMFSPRIRLAYPISASTSARLGYGRSIEAPVWSIFFQNANADLDFVSTSAFFGRDVKFAMSSQIDFGVRSALGRDVVIDVAGYLKDLPQYVARFRPFADPFNPPDTVNIAVLTVDEVHGVGLDARIDWRVGDWLTASGAYSLLRAPSGDAGVTTQALAAIATLQAPNDGPAFTRDLTAQLSLRATSGIAYHPAPINVGLGTITPSSPLTIATGSARLPSTKRVDVRLTKGVRAGGRAWTVYADVRNLFNSQNTRAVFDETGSVVNTQHRIQALAPEYGNLTAEASGSGALEPDGTTINLSTCASWVNPVNCVMLTRVERRFGDGNGLYSLAEQQQALNAYYDAFDGPWFFFNPGRTLRIGVEVEL